MPNIRIRTAGKYETPQSHRLGTSDWLQLASRSAQSRPSGSFGGPWGGFYPQSLGQDSFPRAAGVEFYPNTIFGRHVWKSPYTELTVNLPHHVAYRFQIADHTVDTYFLPSSCPGSIPPSARPGRVIRSASNGQTSHVGAHVETFRVQTVRTF